VKFKEDRLLADPMSVPSDVPEGEGEANDEQSTEAGGDGLEPTADAAVAVTGADGGVSVDGDVETIAPGNGEDEESEAPDEGEETETPEPSIEELLEAAEKRAEVAEKEIGYRNAEIQNVRKRMAAERVEAVQYARMGLAGRMLAVLDDVDRALSALPEGEEGKMAIGLQLMRNRLWQELSASGVIEISTDIAFDPKLHEAITTIPASEAAPPKSIVSVLEPGYRYKERIIKAARVVVAAAPTAPVTADTPEETSEPDSPTEPADSTTPDLQPPDDESEE